MAVYGADLEDLQAISEMLDVQRLDLNSTHQMEPYFVDRPRGDLESTSLRLPQNLTTINVGEVWEMGIRGQGVVIAGQDTGYAWWHPSLKNQYRGFNHEKGTTDHNYNWHDAIRRSLAPEDLAVNCQYGSEEPCDDRGHGTHTMGNMVGTEGSSNQIGVAPESQWIGCRNMDRGHGTPSTYIECFQYFLAPYALGADPFTEGRPDLAPHIINNSWSCPPSEGCSGHEFIDIVRVLREAGIAVVVSAGNEGPRCGSNRRAPGFYSGEVISVGAFDQRNGRIASFSSRGPSEWNGDMGPNITGPGVAVRSAVPRGGLGNGLYDYKSGTSMSGPHVAGVIALMWSAQPDLVGRVDETMEILYKTATPRTVSQTCGPFDGRQVPNATFGHGMVNALEAVKYSVESFR